MPIISTLIVPACAGCCGGGEPFLVWRCESLTGTASLCGFSGYDDGSYDAMNPEAWEGQYRKWKYKTGSGSMTRDNRILRDSDGEILTFTIQTVEHDTSYTLTCDPADSAADYCLAPFTVNDNGSSSEGFLTCSEGQDFFDASYPGVVGSGADSSYYSITLTSRSLIGYGDAQVSESGDGTFTTYLKHTGTVADTLSEEVYLYDALASILEGDPEADVVAGEECCSSLTEAGLTSPGSTDSISLTGTAARARIFVFGDPLTEYNVAVTLTRGEEERIVLIGADGMVPTYYYPPFAPPDTDPWCVTAVALYTP